jgi:hypothetical protein
MIKSVASILCLQALFAIAALASPGDDLLIARLPKDLQNASKVPETPLVQATKEAVKGDRSLAPQITAAAVRRAMDCAAAEAVLRAALRQLAPTPTAMELFAITRAAVGAAPHDESTSVNDGGNKVVSGNCAEALLTAAASEYPNLASVLSDSGKQIAQKQVSGSEEGIGQSPEQGIGNTEPVAPIIPPAVTFPPTGGGLVTTTTPVTATR